MQPPKDEPPLCAHCEEIVATESYAFGQTEMVCAACLERAQVRDAFISSCSAPHGSGASRGVR